MIMFILLRDSRCSLYAEKAGAGLLEPVLKPGYGH